MPPALLSSMHRRPRHSRSSDPYMCCYRRVSSVAHIRRVASLFVNFVFLVIR
jgi:hypothetical protein